MGRSRIQPGDGDPRHGTRNGYNNLDCRCEGCTIAHRIYHREQMRADPRRSELHALKQRLRRRARRV